MKFTTAQMANYEDYERVRAEGRYNMFDPQALTATGLSRAELVFVMNNYAEMRDQEEQERSKWG